MSKASDYAHHCKQAATTRPRFDRGRQYNALADIDDEGNLRFPTGGATIMPEEIPTFITWLQDTFGEPTHKVPNE